MSDTITTQEARDVGAWGQALALSFRFLMFVAGAIAIGWMVSNFRQVPADNQAVVVRFGHVARTHGSGLLLALPRPLETVTLIPAAARQIPLRIERFTEGQQRTTENLNNGYDLNDKPRLNAGFLLTGDSSVVHLEAQLYYQVNDPEAYMVSVDHIRPALQRLLIASAVETLAGRDLYTVLVARPEAAARNNESARRERLRADLMNAVNGRLQKLADAGASLGIKVGRVDLVPSIPRGAHAAFDSVLAVTQDSARTIAAAQTNKEITSQRANSDKDRITSDATAVAEENVSKAKIATASITALSQVKDMSRDMQMSRLYYDRIGAIVKKAGKSNWYRPVARPQEVRDEQG